MSEVVRKAHAFGLELLAQRRIVVDLAVEDDDEPSVVADHWLRGALREIEDRKPAVTEAAASILAPPHPRAVRPASTHRLSSSRAAQLRLEQLAAEW